MPADAHILEIDKAQPDALKAQQDDLWRGFHRMLETLKSEERGLELTYDHIAKGLELSRQRLYKFMKEPEQGLPIQRYNVLKLWEYITDPDLAGATLSANAREKRQALREHESQLRDSLLEAAGFLPTAQEKPESTAQIMRVQRRLTSPLLSKSQIGDITDTILNVISDQGAYLLQRSAAQAGASPTDAIDAEAAKTWPQDTLRLPFHKSVMQSYRSAIERFAKIGKISFCTQELFELYQGIDENHALNLDAHQPRAVDCQFQSVSISLTEVLQDGLRDRAFAVGDRLQRRVEMEYFRSEQWLRSRQPISSYASVADAAVSGQFPPVILASATVQVKELSEELTFRYASGSTHIESVLIALSEGMGSFLSAKSLTMDRMYVKSLGKGSESLVRVSVGLTATSNKACPTRTYQGLWVEQNAVLGILQATTLAAMSWLECYLGKAHLPEFYQLCGQTSTIQRSLGESISKIFDLREFSTFTDRRAAFLTVEETLQKNVVKALQDLARDFHNLLQKPLNENRITREDEKWYAGYREDHQVKLDCKNLLAKVTLAYAQLTSDRPNTAEKTLKELSYKLYRGDFAETTNARFASMTALFVSARTHYRIMTGSERLREECSRPLSEKVMQGDRIFDDFRNYTETVREGVIDFEVYLAAGSFCAAMALLTFYVPLAPSLDTATEMGEAIDLFIRAAHYAAKIGHRYQARRYLCFASRLSARLGRNDDAMSLLAMGRKLIDSEYLSLKPSDFHLYLSQTELYLFSQPQPQQVSRDDLLKALACALLACRLIQVPPIAAASERFSGAQVDALYGLCRVMDAIACEPGYSVKDLQAELGQMTSREVMADPHVANIAADLDFDKVLPPLVETVQNPPLLLAELLDLNQDCAEVVVCLRNRIIDQLNQWHRAYRKSNDLEDADQAEHPLSEVIRARQFLVRLP